MYKQEIVFNIEQGKSQAIYGRDMFHIYKQIQAELYATERNKNDTDYKCIYIDTQTNKEIIISGLTAIKNIDAKEKKLNKATQEELIQILIATLPNKKLIIFYNYMEDISNKKEELFKRLMRHKVLFVAGFQKLPKKNRIDFFKKHEFVNKAEYEILQGENNIDITYFFYMFITLFIVLIFLRIVSLGTIGDIISSALWFGLLVFRTFSYIGGKV